MKLYEYQVKSHYAKFNIPIPTGSLVTRPDEAVDVANRLGPYIAIKPQALGQLGQAKLAENSRDVYDIAHNLFTNDTRALLIESALFYQAGIALRISRHTPTGQTKIIAEGTIEHESARSMEFINPLLGLHNYQARNLANDMNIPREFWDHFSEITQALYLCYIQSDAEHAEITPLAIMDTGDMYAVGAQMTIDDDALFRQADLMRYHLPEDDTESARLARNSGIRYVELDGQVGVIANGTGLSLATLDLIHRYGDGAIRPANFLDIGADAQEETIIAAMEILLLDHRVKAVLLNVFGGMTSCEAIARGIIAACAVIQPTQPIIVRLAGHKSEVGREMIANARINSVIEVANLSEAARTAVEAARET